MKQEHFLVVGMNHETAPVEVREKYAVTPEEARRALETLKPAASEALFLSTCNRVEFYLRAEGMQTALDRVRKWFQERHPLKDAVADRVFYRRNGPEAFRHLFRVAASLDSMVVGEAQILGQVKDAYQAAVKAGTIGSFLNAVFQRAFAAAKRVRSRTGIARWPVSVSSVAVDLALKIFGRLDELTVLILGAGEMSENTARHLVTSGVKRFFVANRTMENARVLARRLKGRALTLPKGLEILREADIVISSIGGQRPFLKAKTVRDAMSRRRGKPLFLIDIGVPRNIEPEAGRIESVYLFNIDDLSRAAQVNLGERAKAVASAEVILEEDLQGLRTWLKHRSLVPAIQDLQQQIETIRSREWEGYLLKNPGLDGKALARMERLTKSLTAKFLHASTMSLKERGGEIRLVGYAEAVRGLFVLDSKKKKRERVLMPLFRLGTRGSALALAQAERVRIRVEGVLQGRSAVLETFHTTGDRFSMESPAPSPGPREIQGLFTRELDEALLAGKVEACIHSLKDLPVVLAPGTALAAVLERGDFRDAVVAARSGSFHDLPNGSRIGTSSPRRTALLRNSRPDVTVVPLRGNLDTRLQKLKNGQFDAILVASAGLERLGRLGEATAFLEPPEFLPSPAQGALCLTARSGDAETLKTLSALDHAPTRICVEAERSFLRHLQGGCSVPVGALAREEGGKMTLLGVVVSLDGSEAVRGEMTGEVSQAAELGRRLAEDCLSRGADEILKSIRAEHG